MAITLTGYRVTLNASDYPTKYDNLLTYLEANVGAKGGDTWSGDHVFSGTCTVPAPSVGGHAANKTYVDGLAFSTALPGQSAGVAGFALVTNGSSASWGARTAHNRALANSCT